MDGCDRIQIGLVKASRARASMIEDCVGTIRTLNLQEMNNQQLFELWSLVMATKQLWGHARPHHHREIAVLIDNGKKELFVL